MKIKITSGENYAVLGLEGAMLNSLNKNNTEYLWQGDAKYWAGQAPVCFPITGVLPNGEMEAFGKRCTMKRHGVVRINPFEVLEQHKNSVTFVQRSDENTKRDFPFDYELKIKYTINGDTVTNEYIVTNTVRTSSRLLSVGIRRLIVRLQRVKNLKITRLFSIKILQSRA